MNRQYQNLKKAFYPTEWQKRLHNTYSSEWEKKRGALKPQVSVTMFYNRPCLSIENNYTSQSITASSSDYYQAITQAIDCFEYYIMSGYSFTQEDFNKLFTFVFLCEKYDQDTTVRHTRFKSKTYIIKDDNTGLYKIGKSINPNFRERTLQSEKPTIKLVALIENDIESYLHREYSEQRVRGEWFALSPIQVRYICSTYATL